MTVQSWGAAPPQLQSCGGKLPPLPPPRSPVPAGGGAGSNHLDRKHREGGHRLDTEHECLEDSVLDVHVQFLECSEDEKRSKH